MIDASPEGNIVKLTGGLGFADLSASQQGNDLVLAIRGDMSARRQQDYSTSESRRWRDGDGEFLVANEFNWRSAA